MNDFTRITEFFDQLNGPVLYLVIILVVLISLWSKWLETGKRGGVVRFVKIVVLVLAVASLIAALTGNSQLTVLNLVGQIILITIYLIGWVFTGLGNALMSVVHPYMTWWRP